MARQDSGATSTSLPSCGRAVISVVLGGSAGDTPGLRRQLKASVTNIYTSVTSVKVRGAAWPHHVFLPGLGWMRVLGEVDEDLGSLLGAQRRQGLVELRHGLVLDVPLKRVVALGHCLHDLGKVVAVGG